MQNFWKNLEQSLDEKDLRRKKALEGSLEQQNRRHASKSMIANRVPPVNQRPRIYLGKRKACPTQISIEPENGYSFHMYKNSF